LFAVLLITLPAIATANSADGVFSISYNETAVTWTFAQANQFGWCFENVRVPEEIFGSDRIVFRMISRVVGGSYGYWQSHVLGFDFNLYPLETGRGYYLSLDPNITSGYPFTVNLPTVNEVTYNFVTGWNLFGWCFAPKDIETFLSEMPGKVCQNLATKNYSTGGYAYLNNIDCPTGKTTSSDGYIKQLEPYRAYWLYAFEPFTVKYQAGVMVPPPDTTPPTVTLVEPLSGFQFPAGTSSIKISVISNEAATCGYATSTGMDFAAMKRFEISGTTSHNATITGLQSGSYTYYIKCQDQAGNINPSEVKVSFSIAQPLPPVILLSEPVSNTEFPAGTASVTLRLLTDQASTCKWSRTSSPFDLMTPFASTGGTSHANPVTGLQNDTNYTFYVRCQSALGVLMPDEQTFAFRIAATPPPPDITPPIITLISPQNNEVLPNGTVSIDLKITTDEDAECRYATSQIGFASKTSFSFTGGRNHSTSISGLLDGKSYEYFFQCRDKAGNTNLDLQSRFSVALPPDTIPPIITLISPEDKAILPYDTTSVELTIITNEKAECRYARVPDALFSSMPKFAISDGMKHTQTLRDIISGKSYSYFVKCSDTSGNINQDYPIKFGVAEPPLVCAHATPLLGFIPALHNVSDVGSRTFPLRIVNMDLDCKPALFQVVVSCQTGWSCEFLNRQNNTKPYISLSYLGPGESRTLELQIKPTINISTGIYSFSVTAQNLDDAQSLQRLAQLSLGYEYIEPPKPKSVCGNNICETMLNESTATCPLDCVQAALEKKEIKETIATGKNLTISTEKPAELGLTNLTITVNKTVESPVVAVEKLAAVPARVNPPAVAEKIFTIVNITTTNITSAEFEKAKATTQVDKEWVKANRIKPETLKMYRFDERTNNWTDLPTKIVNEDSKSIFLEAELPGLSLFAVTGKSAGLLVIPETSWSVTGYQNSIIGKTFRLRNDGDLDVGDIKIEPSGELAQRTVIARVPTKIAPQSTESFDIQIDLSGVTEGLKRNMLKITSDSGSGTIEYVVDVRATATQNLSNYSAKVENLQKAGLDTSALNISRSVEDTANRAKASFAAGDFDKAKTEASKLQSTLAAADTSASSMERFVRERLIGDQTNLIIIATAAIAGVSLTLAAVLRRKRRIQWSMTK